MVLVHVAASKQLLTLALYLFAVREEIGLNAGNFLAAVAHQCLENAEGQESDDMTAVVDSLAP